MNDINWELIERHLGLIPKKEVLDPSNCKDCKVPLVINEGQFVCPKCGLVNRQELVSYFNNHSIKYKILYKRQSYYTEKLRQFMRQKKCKHPHYHKLILKIKKKPFKTIHDLKRVMQELKYGKYYKFIYNIFYEIKGKHLIDIDNQDLPQINTEFLKLEKKFKKHFTDIKYFPSYNVTIYFILKKLNYDCCKHILLPLNFKKKYKFIRNIDSC